MIFVICFLHKQGFRRGCSHITSAVGGAYECWWFLVRGSRKSQIWLNMWTTAPYHSTSCDSAHFCQNLISVQYSTMTCFMSALKFAICPFFFEQCNASNATSLYLITFGHFFDRGEEFSALPFVRRKISVPSLNWSLLLCSHLVTLIYSTAVPLCLMKMSIWSESLNPSVLITTDSHVIITHALTHREFPLSHCTVQIIGLKKAEMSQSYAFQNHFGKD